MQSNEDLHAAYQELEEKMRKLAEADGNVFLPNLEPEDRVDYVLICMEPSLGRWADSAEEARSKVDRGFRNFVFSIEDFILHFCARRYLCEPGERYHITDLAKGAMLVKQAGSSRYERYDRWYPLFKEEVNLITGLDAGFIAVGRVVADYLERKQFERPLDKVIHYSPLAARARNAAILGREEEFQAFRDSVTLEDLKSAAGEVLNSSRMPTEFRSNAMSRLERGKLTPSRKKLIFVYKITFESARS